MHFEFVYFYFVLNHLELKTIPDFRPKWAKCIPVFRPKRAKNPTRWGDIYLYGLYKGVPPVWQSFYDCFRVKEVVMNLW